MNIIIGIIVRHVLTGLGAVLVAKGYMDESTVQALIGAVTTILGAGLSVLNKYNLGALGKGS
jgi:hypothetical protein